MFYVRIYQKVKKCFNVKSSTYYFHMKTKILVDFHICISVPLKQVHVICFLHELLIFCWLIQVFLVWSLIFHCIKEIMHADTYQNKWCYKNKEIYIISNADIEESSDKWKSRVFFEWGVKNSLLTVFIFFFSFMNIFFRNLRSN